MYCYEVDKDLHYWVRVRYPYLRLHDEGGGEYARIPVGGDTRALLCSVLASVPPRTDLGFDRATIAVDDEDESYWLEVEVGQPSDRALLLIRARDLPVTCRYNRYVHPLFLDELPGDKCDRLFVLYPEGLLRVRRGSEEFIYGWEADKEAGNLSELHKSAHKNVGDLRDGEERHALVAPKPMSLVKPAPPVKPVRQCWIPAWGAIYLEGREVGAAMESTVILTKPEWPLEDWMLCGHGRRLFGLVNQSPVLTDPVIGLEDRTVMTDDRRLYRLEGGDISQVQRRLAM